MKTVASALTALFFLAACGLEAPRSQPKDETRAPPIALDVMASHIVAQGEDWRLDSDPQAGLTLALDSVGEVISADYAAPGRDESGAMRIASGRLAITLAAASCVDGDLTFPMSARVAVQGGPTLDGCAYPRWDNRLPDLLPAIDACLSPRAEGARVLYAGGENGRVLVRVAEGETRYDCRAPRDPGGGPAITTVSDPELKLAGEGDPVFVRAPGVKPGGECYDPPEARGPGGALIGWLDDGLGC